MADFNWSGYDKWLNPPSIHEDCHCENCHRSHMEEHEVEENAKRFPGIFICCVEEMESREYQSNKKS